MKEIITNYTFTPATKQINFSSYVGFDIKRLTAIINETSNQLIYQAGNPTYGLQSETGSLVTLIYNTASMNASDKLQIHYEVTPSNQDLTNTKLDSVINNTSLIDLKLDSISTNANQDLTNTKLDSIIDNTSLITDSNNSLDSINTKLDLVSTLSNQVSINNSIDSTNLILDESKLALESIDNKLSGTLQTNVLNFPAIQQISANALPLPINASTSALQTTQNTKLDSIITNTSNIPTVGQKVSSLSLPVTISNEQAQDLFIIGQSGQSVAGNNVLLNVAGSTPIDTISNSSTYRSFSIQIVGTLGISAGQILFEHSHDDITYTPMTWQDDNVTSGLLVTTPLAIASNTSRYFSGKISYRYIKCRITTGFTGGTIRAYTRLSTSEYAYRTQNVTQPSGGNFATSINSSLPTGTGLIGDVGIQVRANATGSATIRHIISSASTNATIVKASAGRVLGWSLTNTTASFKFVKLHNQTTLPTAGAGVVQTIAIPPNSVNNFDIVQGVGFTTGIGLTIVNGALDNDSVSVGANDVIGDLYFG